MSSSIARGIRAAFLVLTAFVASQAHAAISTFDYSYTFHTGDIVAGSFDGVAAGNIISNISNATANLNGAALTGSGNFFIGGFQALQAVISLDGTSNAFAFYDKDPSLGQPLGSVFDIFAQNSFAEVLNLSPFAYSFDFSQFPYTPSRWSVTQRAAPVPEPATALLVTGGLFAVLIARRKLGEQ